jgi:hypothetical protein
MEITRKDTAVLVTGTLMKCRTLFLVSVIILGLILPGAVMADARGGGQEGFVGLWEAIDSFDGSTQLLSITCIPDKSCDVRLNDTAFTLSCHNQIGFARGLGSIKGDTLTVELTLYCSNLDGTSTLAGTQENAFVLNRRNGTLTNINDDPVPVPNVFHRISR